MARSLHKTDAGRLTVRFTPEQRRRLELVAQAESRRRGEVMELATLIREFVMRRVEELLATDRQPSEAA